ncbi:hypothetical protein [Haloarcula pellucida]|nr:hypothetical protein [Halomicroarcula pellucida]MBX0349552.1 hypothetical protein [Halomicroarcula pellucida]
MLDTNGSVRWEKTLEQHLSPPGIVRTDSGYAVGTMYQKPDSDHPVVWFGLLDNDGSIRSAEITNTEVETPSGVSLSRGRHGYAFVVARRSAEWNWAVVTGFDTTGTHQWTTRYEIIYTPTFIESSQDGFVIGGEQERADAPWVSVIDGDGTKRWTKTAPVDENSSVTSGLVDDRGGIVLGEYGGLIRLTASGDVDWRRTYDVFVQDGKSSVPAVAQTAEGFVAATDEPKLTLLSVNRDGEQRETRTYDFECYLSDLIALASGAVLVVGERSTADGLTPWAALLADETPTVDPPTITPTTNTPVETTQSTPTDGDQSTDTPTSATSKTNTRTETTTEKSGGTGAAGPGFGVSTGIASVLGGAWLRSRSAEDD